MATDYQQLLVFDKTKPNRHTYKYLWEISCFPYLNSLKFSAKMFKEMQFLHPYNYIYGPISIFILEAVFNEIFEMVDDNITEFE